jgi:DNA replication protein DnaC
LAPWIGRDHAVDSSAVTADIDQWGRFLPEHTTAVSLLDRLLHHSIVVVTEGESFRMRQARSQGGTRMKRT